MRESVSALVQGGYLRRIQGKGTFVVRCKGTSSGMETYAVFSQAQTHVYGPETRALVREIQNNGALTFLVDTTNLIDAVKIEEIIAKVLAAGIAGVIADAQWAILIHQYCERKSLIPPATAVLNVKSALGPTKGVKYVLSDLTQGTYLGTQHLLGLGCRSIAFVIHRGDWRRPPHVSAPDQVQDAHGEILRGYTQALAEAGLAGTERYFFIDNEFAPGSDDRNRLHQLLSGAERPDAVFAFGDYRAKQVIDIADEVGLRVPEDLAVIGYWNTPWADLVRVPLTSICIQEEEIARIAAQKVMAASRQGLRDNETILVPPQLVVRESCGERKECVA